MGKNVAQKLIESHLVEGKMIPGEEIGIKIDHTLTQDATGTMVMLELEAMGLKSGSGGVGLGQRGEPAVRLHPAITLQNYRTIPLHNQPRGYGGGAKP